MGYASNAPSIIWSVPEGSGFHWRESSKDRRVNVKCGKEKRGGLMKELCTLLTNALVPIRRDTSCRIPAMNVSIEVLRSPDE